MVTSLQARLSRIVGRQSLDPGLCHVGDLRLCDANSGLSGAAISCMLLLHMALAIQWIGSPNKTKGRGGFRPEAVVIHIMDGTLAGTDVWFNNPASKVSAHYGIGSGGAIHQYVGETDTAWHAGRKFNPTWTLIKAGVNPNLYTIGIEHEGRSDTPWSEAMYQSSAALVQDICSRHAIPADRQHIIGHREIYAKKTCPGTKVDLDKLVELARGGLLAPGSYNFIEQSGATRARAALNLRRGVPTTHADVVSTVPAGTQLSYAGWTSNGQNVNGNAHWYRDGAGNYFWAGATEDPVPGLG